jgi:hypothetical protein
MENLYFFWDYQLKHMYIRYFLWNFVGRAFEEQDSDWESGLNFARLYKLPPHKRKDPSKAHYYGLPLLLGLLGATWHFQRNRRHAMVILTLFFMTGVAIILYLNQPPNQPRERDYSYVGSFIVFAMWVGMGAAAITNWLQEWLQRNWDLPVGMAAVGVPILMAVQNWRSHSRAGNYVPPDAAYNFLMSCPPNAILFTNGDNDTFPLWYLQEVEGVRTDVRIVNLSLLNTDWYISQLKYNSPNGAPPVPISAPDELFMGEKTASIPAKSQSLAIPIDKTAFLNNYPTEGRFSEEDLADTLYWKLPVRGSGQNTYLLKQDFMTYDIVTTAIREGWKRPICFANTLPSFSYLGLSDYLYQRGNVYELLPLKPRYSTKRSIYNAPIDAPIDAPIQDSLTHQLLTQVFRYRNLNNPKIFYDSNTLRMINTYRSVFYRLAGHYVQKALEKDTVSRAEAEAIRQKARELLSFLRQAISPEACPLEAYQLAREANLWLGLGDTLQANRLLAEYLARLEAYQIAQEANLWLRLGDTLQAKRLLAENLARLEGEVEYLAAVKEAPDSMLLYGADLTLRTALAISGDTTLTMRALKLNDRLRALPPPRRRARRRG